MILVFQDVQKAELVLKTANQRFCFWDFKCQSSMMTCLKMWSLQFAHLFYVGDTAVREVFEETGIKSEFRSLLSIRQQHSLPAAFGKSDLYVVCRLQPRSFSIDCCPQECLRCEWVDLGDLVRAGNATPITSRVARLLLYGLREGFDKVDLTMEELPAASTGLLYKLYHRALPEEHTLWLTDWIHTDRLLKFLRELSMLINICQIIKCHGHLGLIRYLMLIF